MTRPVLHPMVGSMSFPLASLALEIVKHFKLLAIERYTVPEATSFPGHCLFSIENVR